MTCLKRVSLVSFALVFYASSISILSHTCDAHAFHVDHTDEEIARMDIEALLHVENDLRQQNSAVDKQVASLHGRLDKIHFQQQQLDNKHKKIGSARDWEAKQRSSRTLELTRAKGQLQSKKQQKLLLVEQGEKLHREIRELEQKTNHLHLEESELKHKYMHPSFAEVVMNKAEKLGSVPEHLANKTVETIFPEVQLGLKEAELVQRKLETLTVPSTVFISLCVYVLGLSVISLACRCLQKMQKMLTLQRMLFTIDMAFTVMWCLVILCSGTILQDPLQVMVSSHVSLAVVVQILLMASLSGNVFMRCLLVSVRLGGWSFVELFWAVFIAQHYYQAIWVPFLLDQDLKSGVATYFGYMVIHCTMGILRARSIGKVQHIRGTAYSFENRKSRSQNPNYWLRQRLGNAVQYMEDFLTTGSIQQCSSVNFEACSDEAPKEIARASWGG